MYHKEFEQCFNDMQFSYDNYTKTETEYHKEHVKVLFEKMYKNGYIYEKEEELYHLLEERTKKLLKEKNKLQ